MSKKADPLMVGIFVLGAMALGLAGLLVFSGGRFFEDTFDCVMFFDESVSGLDAGAPVDFQGVRIGTVTDVHLEVRLGPTNIVQRPVTVKLDERRIRFTGVPDDDVDIDRFMDRMVRDHGLRARLAVQSLLTGKLKVELGFFPDTPVMRRGVNTRLWEMPTIASPFQRFTSEVAQLPIHAIVDDVHNILKGLSALVAAPETHGLAGNINDTLDRMRVLLDRVDDEIGPLAQRSGALLDSADTVATELQTVLRRLDEQLPPLAAALTTAAEHAGNLLDERAPLRNELLRLIDELAAAGRSLRLLADYLERHPESLWRGKRHGD